MAVNDIETQAEKAQEEAYRKGYEDATVKISSDEQAIAEKAYQSGLNDAWEAARKICLNESDGGLSAITVHDIFNTEHYRDALRDYTPAKAIEKIRQYEQKKEQEQEQIQVGDEIEAVSGKAVVVYVDDIDEHKVRYVYSNGVYAFNYIDKVTKTGRHFPEIAEVLAKMKEES